MVLVITIFIVGTRQSIDLSMLLLLVMAAPTYQQLNAICVVKGDSTTKLCVMESISILSSSFEKLQFPVLNFLIVFLN